MDLSLVLNRIIKRNGFTDRKQHSRHRQLFVFVQRREQIDIMFRQYNAGIVDTTLRAIFFDRLDPGPKNV
jgi:hypothetical protein